MIGKTRRAKILKALTSPSIINDYVFRSRKLSKIIPEHKTEIDKFLREADDIAKELENFSKSHGNFVEVRLLDTSVTYAIVRTLKPGIVMETGVSNGVSTYFILKALEQNKNGLVYSIDLPRVISSASIPPDRGIGWLVPEELRDRWKLLLGDAKETLPELLSELHEIDVFLHDSNHSYAHMTFEFRTVWKYLREGGFLLSHDIDKNKAFEDFMKEVNVRQYGVFGNLGVIKKREDV